MSEPNDAPDHVALLVELEAELRLCADVAHDALHDMRTTLGQSSFNEGRREAFDAAAEMVLSLRESLLDAGPGLIVVGDGYVNRDGYQPSSVVPVPIS